MTDEIKKENLLEKAKKLTEEERKKLNDRVHKREIEVLIEVRKKLTNALDYGELRNDNAFDLLEKAEELIGEALDYIVCPVCNTNEGIFQLFNNKTGKEYYLCQQCMEKDERELEPKINEVCMACSDRRGLKCKFGNLMPYNFDGDCVHKIDYYPERTY